MIDFASTLVGRELREFRTHLDYAQLSFDDQAILNIYNRCHAEHMGECQTGSRYLAEVLVEGDQITFLFEPCGRLEVGTRGDDYRGPEAMSYHPVHGCVVVWN